MNIQELIEKLQSIIEVDPELATANVQIVTQHHYPLITQLSHVKLESKNASEIADVQEELNTTVDLDVQVEMGAYIEQLERDEEHTLMLVEGNWVGYGSSKLWDIDE